MLGTPEPSSPVACTLTGEDYRQRIAWIFELARDCLRGVEVRDLTVSAPERARGTALMLFEQFIGSPKA